MPVNSLYVYVYVSTSCIFRNSKQLQRHDSVHLSSVYTDYSFYSLQFAVNVIANIVPYYLHSSAYCRYTVFQIEVTTRFKIIYRPIILLRPQGCR